MFLALNQHPLDKIIALILLYFCQCARAGGLVSAFQVGAQAFKFILAQPAKELYGILFGVLPEVRFDSAEQIFSIMIH